MKLGPQCWPVSDNWPLASAIQTVEFKPDRRTLAVGKQVVEGRQSCHAGLNAHSP
jgi:hypothetical protein